MWEVLGGSRSQVYLLLIKLRLLWTKICFSVLRRVEKE